MNVIIFKAESNLLMYAGDSVTHGHGADAVPVVLDVSTGSLRGHYSRLLQRSVYNGLESALQREVKAKEHARLEEATQAAAAKRHRIKEDEEMQRQDNFFNLK